MPRDPRCYRQPSAELSRRNRRGGNSPMPASRLEIGGRRGRGIGDAEALRSSCGFNWVVSMVKEGGPSLVKVKVDVAVARGGWPR